MVVVLRKMITSCRYHPLLDVCKLVCPLLLVFIGVAMLV